MSQKSFYTRSLQASQQEPAWGKPMVCNNAGGYVFSLSPEKQLDRFLILGTESASYYRTAREMTLDNTQAIREMIHKDGPSVVLRTTVLSQSGRAPRNDPALFVLALCLTEGNAATKEAVKANIHKVARTATHFFLFLQYATAVRGWGRALKGAAANWYRSQSAMNLAYQATKYQNRLGWRHHDVLNLAHVKPDAERASIFQLMVRKETAAMDRAALLQILEEHDSREDLSPEDYYRFCSNIALLEPDELDLSIRRFRLPHEVLPSDLLSNPVIWKALLETELPMTALIRNIGRMASLGIFQDAACIDLLEDSLVSSERLARARVHPLTLLTAWKTYGQGHGSRGRLSWKVEARVLEILERAFYEAFKTIAPTGKRLFIGLDVSGSMTAQSWGGLTSMEIAAVMSMSVIRTEPDVVVKAFSHELQDVRFGKDAALDEVLREMENVNFGMTDCALPMLYARQHRIPVDAFLVYTDCETWWGDVHPFQALKMYRAEMGIPAKLVVVATDPNEFTIADPSDAGMLDIVGFDSAVPQVVEDFIRG